jgi:hypothetical protein
MKGLISHEKISEFCIRNILQCVYLSEVQILPVESIHSCRKRPRKLPQESAARGSPKGLTKETIMSAKRLTLPQRQEIFHTLVATQDVVRNVRKSYQVVTEKFEISEKQLREIEDEGLDNEWPPLNEAVQEVG